MFRMNVVSKLLQNGQTRSLYTAISSNNLTQSLVYRERIFARCYNSDSIDKDKIKKFKEDKYKKAEKTRVESYPTSGHSKLKNSKPGNVYLGQPPSILKKKIIPLEDSPPASLMSSAPPSSGGDWKDKSDNNKGKYRSTLIAGVLVTAATFVALYFYGFAEKPKKKGKKLLGKDAKAPEQVRLPPVADIPKEVPYLLIGGGTASFSAFRAIKSADPQARVLVVTNEMFYPYMRPPLSKEIWQNDQEDATKKMQFKQWNGSERSLYYEPEDFYVECKDLLKAENGGVAVARGWTITHLDVPNKTAYLDDGTTIKYDKCLIATGAKPKKTPVFEAAMSNDGNVQQRVKIFRHVNDFFEVHKEFTEAKTIAIIGGGFLGSELACALARKGKNKSKIIYQIFGEGGNMGKVLPEYLSCWTTEKIKAEGVQVMSNTQVVEVEGKKDSLVLTLKDGRKIPVELAIVAAGVEPNTELAEKSGLEVDPELGGYLVNTELMARSNLYVAGDCACFYDAQLGRRRVEHHDHAVISGRLAGENMAGGSKAYLHQSMFWSDLGPDVGYEAIGIVDSQLPTVGVFAKATEAETTVESASKEESSTEKVKQEEGVPKKTQEDYGKGVIFYLRDGIVVGIVLWNVFNRMSIARQVLKDHRKYDDLNEVAKLFNIHEE